MLFSSQVIPKNILMIGPTGCGKVNNIFSRTCSLITLHCMVPPAISPPQQIIHRFSLVPFPRHADGDRPAHREAVAGAVHQGGGDQVHRSGLPRQGRGPDYQGPRRHLHHHDQEEAQRGNERLRVSNVCCFSANGWSISPMCANQNFHCCVADDILFIDVLHSK